MKLLSCGQPAKSLGIQCPPVDYAQNSWVYSWQSCDHHMSDLYFVLKISWIWCDFCACADLLIQPMHTHLTLSPSCNLASSKEKKSSKLLYTPILIVREKELLLVNECTDRLGPFGSTLWVVSMNQVPKNCDLLNPISMWHAHARQKKFVNTFVCLNSWMYMVDLNLCMTMNIIIVHPRISIFISYYVIVCPIISIFISYFVVECPRISIYSASTPMTMT